MNSDKGFEIKRYWLLFSVLLIFVCYSLYHVALFNGGQPSFDRAIYLMLILISFFSAIVFFMFRKELQQVNLTILIIILALPTSYSISYFFSFSSYLAFNSILIQNMYFFIFLIGLLLTTNKKFSLYLQLLIMLSSYTVVIFGLMNWFGDASFGGLINYSDVEGQYSAVYKDAVLVNPIGDRLSSVFQYPNTYACFLIAILISSLFITSFSKNRTVQTVSSLMLVPIAVSFLLTLSRGGIVVLPVILLITILFFKPAKQILFGLQCIVSFVVAFFLYNEFNDLGSTLRSDFSASGYLKAFLILIIASMISVLLTWLIRKFIEPALTKWLTPLSDRKLSNLVIPISVLAVSIVLLFLFIQTSFVKVLPASVEERIETINFKQHSVLERGIFYKDALKIFADYPVFGAGGGAWTSLFQRYQSYPYVSNESHNFLMTYLVEVGVVGTLAFLLLLIIILFAYIKKFRTTDDSQRYSHFLFFIIIITILIHSLLDFNLSYIYMGSLLFICLGAISQQVKINFSKLQSPKYSKATPYVLIVLSVIILIPSIRLLSGNNNYNKAIENAVAQNKSFQEIIEPLDRAVRISSNPTYLRYRFDFYKQASETLNDSSYTEEVLRTIELYKDKEPLNRNLVYNSTKYYKGKMEYPKAIEFLNEGLVNFPWDIEIYQESITLHSLLGSVTDESHWGTAIDIYNEVVRRAKLLEKLPDELDQGRSFAVTPTIASCIGQIYYYQFDYNKAVNVLESFVPQDFSTEENRIITRYYLAASIKIGSKPEELYNRFVTALPDEITAVDDLLHLDEQ